METIKLRYEALQKALLILQGGIRIIHETTYDQNEEVYIVMRDGLIQRFEYCIDTFWKFIKLYLEEVEKLSLESKAPKEILKKAVEGVITLEEHTVLIKALGDRNLTSHSYNENLAAEIQRQIPVYYITMKTIIDRIKID